MKIYRLTYEELDIGDNSNPNTNIFITSQQKIADCELSNVIKNTLLEEMIDKMGISQIETNQWISVNDRLPKCEDNKRSENVIITNGIIINRGYYSYQRMRWEWNGTEITPTHWMPIPKIK